jgi:hypothetical protein
MPDYVDSDLARQPSRFQEVRRHSDGRLFTTKPYVNVRDFGAYGDDSRDDWEAITSAINACPEGGIVYFPAGVYRVSKPLMLQRNRTYQGAHSSRWFYRGGAPCSIKPHPTFSGAAILYIADKEILGAALDTDGGRIFDLNVDGNSFGTTLIGVLFEGLVRDWKVRGVDSSQTSGNGWVTRAYTRLDASSGAPRGIDMDTVSSYSAGNNGGAGIGFSFASLTDSTIHNALAVSAESQGFLIDSPGEVKYSMCRAVFNKSDGFRITGAVNVGGAQFIGCSTDRNGKYGVQVNATGTQPLQFVGLLTRRDGATTTGGIGNAGFAVIGTAGNLCCAVIVEGIDQTVGVDDGGGGSLTPAYGARVEFAQHVRISGTTWGVTNAVLDNGNVTSLDLDNLLRRNTSNGTMDAAVVGTQPALTLHANNNGGPAPVLSTDANDRRGTLTFGSGATPVVGSQVIVTFSRAFNRTPTAILTPTTGGAASRAPYITAISTTSMTIGLNSVPAASQAATTYGVAFSVTP